MKDESGDDRRERDAAWLSCVPLRGRGVLRDDDALGNGAVRLIPRFDHHRIGVASLHVELAEESVAGSLRKTDQAGSVERQIEAFTTCLRQEQASVTRGQVHSVDS